MSISVPADIRSCMKEHDDVNWSRIACKAFETYMEANGDMTVRNDEGEPFSRWKPSAKYAYILLNRYSEYADYCQKEYEFSKYRKWRFDYAWEKLKIAVEIDGFGYGHQAQQRIAQNNEKRNAAVEAGWRVLVFDSRLLGSKQGVEDAVDQTVRLICGLELESEPAF